jgi:hypothetical protein
MIAKYYSDRYVTECASGKTQTWMCGGKKNAHRISGKWLKDIYNFEDQGLDEMDVK